MQISTIAAIAENLAIGKDNQIPWYLPADLRFFRDHTLGHTVIMGSRTYASIGRALPKRTNIVITSNPFRISSTFLTAHSIGEALELAEASGESEAFIIGGARIYEQTYPLWDRMYLTRVPIVIPDADTFFPVWEEAVWHCISDSWHPPDDKNAFGCRFQEWERINGL